MRKQSVVKKQIAKVIKKAMNKSAVVQVQRTVKDLVFKKYVHHRSTFMVHDEANECRLGDRVEIMESRPYSKLKKWKIAKILERSVIGE